MPVRADPLLPGFAAGDGAHVGRARRARRKFARAPRMVRVAGGVVILFAVVALVNLVYHVILKPTELFAVIGHRLDKEPAETWASYGPLFRTSSTSP